MYADYQEFAAAHARQCRERRNAEEAAQYEREKLTKSATVSSAAEVRKSNGAGAGLVYKTHDDARVADDDSSSRRAAAKSELTWWEWTDQRINSHLKAFAEEAAEGMAEFIGRKLDPIKRELRELELLRREFTILQHEVGVERGLRDLCAEVAEARKQIPQYDAEQKQLKAKQARLEHELAMTKDKLGKLRVDQSLTDYHLREMRKQVDASAGASVELEFEGRSAHFQMKATHPDAAKALKEFAGQIIDGQRDGTLWLPGRAGNA
jgi:hypothetical protein